MADDSPYPQAPFLVPPLPEKVTATTTHDTDVETKKLDPRQQQYFGDLSALREQESTNEEARAELAKTTALYKTADALQNADALDKQMADRQAAYDKTQSDITDMSTRLREARDKFDNAKTQSFFRDGDTHGNVLKGIAVALGGMSDAICARVGVMTGRDQGPSVVDQIVDADMARQKEDIKLMSDKVAIAKGGLQDANEARQLLLAEVDTKAAMAYKRIQQIAAANLASQGVQQADIDKNANIAAWREKELQGQASAVNQLTQQFTKQGKDVTITTNENKDKEHGPTAAEIQLSPTDIFNVNGEKIGEASTPKLADELMHGKGGENSKGALPAYADLRDALVRLRDHEAAKGATLNPLSDDYQKRDQLYHEALILMKGPGKDALGVLTGPDVGIIEGQIGGSIASKTGMGVEKLDPAIDKLDRDAARGLASHGFKHPDQMLQQYRGEIPAPKSPAMAPQTTFVPKKPLTGPVTRDQLKAGETGPTEEPEDVNSTAPLPEDPSAPSIDDFQPPKTRKKLPGVSQLKSTPVPPPPAPSAAAAPADLVTDPRMKAIQMLKANPNRPGARAVMQQFGITPEDLR